ncbi:MAG: NTP transferase domain-containing protein [Pseudomonadales bacterium]|nr:NTP transferase domain-containing protein [Pseudomonadales bacterium]
MTEKWPAPASVSISEAIDNPPLPLGLILAGGLGSRMGTPHKPLLKLAGQTILQHIIDNAHLQTKGLILNVNQDPALFSTYGLPLLTDEPELMAGPLRGIYSALKLINQTYHLTRKPPLLACFPGDTPWFPGNIVVLMQEAIRSNNTEIAWLQTDGQTQPLFSLWSPTLEQPLLEALQAGEFSPRRFIETRKHSLVVLQGLPPHQFYNINDRESLRLAGSLFASACDPGLIKK